jgi:KaiC/GvpD/RAD55 family RecA-like ATPase/5S rRNA maturation endonuclease (ribonuclease M5)
MTISSVSQLWGIKNRPEVNYAEYENNLYNYKTDPMAAEALKYLIEERGMKLSTLQNFHVGYNKEQHEITIPVLKDTELVDYKFRGITEKTFRRHQGSETWVVNELAFQYAEEDGYLICVEGEFDAMALYQLGFRSVVSTTGGAQGATPWVNKIPDGIRVYIYYDNDEAGQESGQKLAERIGLERCSNITTVEKDANDFLRAGKTKEEFSKVLENSKKFKIKDVFQVNEILDALENNRLKRVDVFSPRINAHLDGGIPKQSLVTILGKTGVGKSTLLMNSLVHHADGGHPVFLVSLENDLFFTVQRLLEIKYRKPYLDFTKDDWAQIRKDMEDYPFYIDTSMEAFTVDKVNKIIEQAKKLYGIEFFGFDHIGFLPTRDDPKEISQMVRSFKLLCRKFDIITYMISHVKRSDDDFVTSDHAKGSSSIGQDSDIVLAVVDIKSGMEVVIDKARMSQSHLQIPISFNGDSGVMEDDHDRSVRRYGEELADPVIRS